MVMDNKSTSGLRMRGMFLTFAIIPLVISVLVLTITSIILCSTNLEKQTKESLKVAAYGLKNYYELDLKQPTEEEWPIQYDTAYVDHLLSDDINLTVFQGDTRFVTSLKNADGSRNEGTTCNADIWEQAKKNEDYYSDAVVIGGKDYFVYYTPMVNADKQVVGMAFAGKSCDQVKAVKRNMFIISAVIGVGLLIVSIVIVSIIASIVVAPFDKITDSLQDMSEGDMTAVTNTSSAVKETKILIESSKKLQENVSSMLSEISGYSSELYDKISELAVLAQDADNGTSQIAMAVTELAEGAGSMADNVQNINAEAIELGQLIESISDSVGTLTSSADNMLKANNDASSYILDMEKSSNNTVDSVKDIKEKVEATNNAVKKISEAVDIITGIASQTNLLALNASIEAARAGESGRGFAVVASEIGSLADQCNSSANDIKGIVDNIIKQSVQSVAASNTVEQAIANEQEILLSTKEKFEILNKEINNSVNEVNSISSQVNSIDKVKNIIIDNISDLSSISEENAASSQEVSASVDNIASGIQNISGEGDGIKVIAESLSNMVGKFKI